jgi:hypothetical protein
MGFADLEVEEAEVIRVFASPGAWKLKIHRSNTEWNDISFTTLFT